MIDIIAASTDLGITYDGANQGPKVIIDRLSNKLNKIEIIKPNIIKEKNKTNLAKNLDSIIKYNEKLYKQIDYSLKNNNFPITIGGDHSIATASILASANNNGDIGVIWIDGHTDFNTFETTETGNIHGLPLASVCGLCKKLTNNLNSNFINPKKCVVIGARSIDKEELNNLKNNQVKVFSTNDIKKIGVKKIMEKSLKIAGNKFHVSYDLDVIDPLLAPGVSVPEENGINEEEAYEIMNYLVKEKEKITSLDLVEYNPTFDYNEKTLTIALNLINKFIYSDEK